MATARHPHQVDPVSIDLVVFLHVVNRVDDVLHRLVRTAGIRRPVRATKVGMDKVPIPLDAPVRKTFFDLK